MYHERLLLVKNMMNDLVKCFRTINVGIQNGGVSLESLLRTYKDIVLALNVQGEDGWIDNELLGYEESTTVPDYRQLPLEMIGIIVDVREPRGIGYEIIKDFPVDQSRKMGVLEGVDATLIQGGMFACRKPISSYDDSLLTGRDQCPLIMDYDGFNEGDFSNFNIRVFCAIDTVRKINEGVKVELKRRLVLLAERFPEFKEGLMLVNNSTIVSNRTTNIVNYGTMIGDVNGHDNVVNSGQSKGSWRIPIIVAVIGAVATIIAAYIQGCFSRVEKVDVSGLVSQGVKNMFVIERAYISNVGDEKILKHSFDEAEASKLAKEDLTVWKKKFYDEHKHELNFSLYKKAAEKGDARAQFNLALMYFEGIGTEKNNKLFFSWCRRAADQDLPDALCQLGIAYYNAIGTARNIKRSAQCMERAALLGNARAQVLMGYYCVFGPAFGVKTDFEAAVKWMTLAAEQKYPMAYFQLGWMTYLGLGCSPDYKKAEEWLNKAINSDDAKVAELAREFRKTMNAACRGKK